MMDSLEISAKTVEEAIQEALDQLGVSREEVEVTVVKEGKSGILGMGSDDALVRVTLLEKSAESESAENESAEGDTAETARETVETLLGLMGINNSTVTVGIQPADRGEEEALPSLSVNIEGDDLGILIGRRGQTLTSLQYIVRLIIGRQTETWQPIIIDVEGYKERRYEGLRAFAQQMAEQVRDREAPFSLEPMPAYERRLIHLVLADHPDVVTESMGLGESRRVVIMPKGSKLN